MMKLIRILHSGRRTGQSLLPSIWSPRPVTVKDNGGKDTQEQRREYEANGDWPFSRRELFASSLFRAIIIGVNVSKGNRMMNKISSYGYTQHLLQYCALVAPKSMPNGHDRASSPDPQSDSNKMKCGNAGQWRSRLNGPG